MTCKDCIHYYACKENSRNLIDGEWWDCTTDIDQDMHEYCEFFEEKAKYNVVHGHWISNGDVARCSVCDTVVLMEDESECLDYCGRVNYCFNCGAKMDEKESEQKCVN